MRARPRSTPTPGDWRLLIPEARRRSLRRWFWSIAAMTLAVLVIGGITRLTHSGLSMVEWKPIMGVLPPLSDAQWTATFERYQQFPEYQRLRQGMTLGEFKFIFFWEYLHRLAARAIGLVFVVPFLVFWKRGDLPRPLAARALGLFALGAMQGVMGWLMVASGLVERPSVSHYRLAMHLGLAFVIFGYCVWLTSELRVRPARAVASREARRLMTRGLIAIGALLAVQVTWGALVAGLKAGLVFNTFPLMAGSLVPPNLLWLEPALLNFVENASAVQWAHRLVGTMLVAAAAILAWRVLRAGADRRSRALGLALLTLVAIQYLSGVLTLVYAVPVSLAVFHQATAMAIAGVWVSWLHHVVNLPVAKRAAPPVAQASGRWVREAVRPKPVTP